MKKYVILILCCLVIFAVVINIDTISSKIANLLENNPTVVIPEKNEYFKEDSFIYIKNASDFVPYSYNDLLKIIYTTINSGWDTFTFYCPKEYTNCLNDLQEISKDELILTHINNFVHPYNGFTNIKTTMYDSGEAVLTVYYLYTDSEINQINARVNNILTNILTNDMDEYTKIKTIHDFIINNTKYDSKAIENDVSEYNSYKAYGPLVEGYATCNGYTDLMAIFLTEMGYKNYKIATTPDEISYSSTGHIWNAIYFENEWLHIDLTWDDPVGTDGKDYLFHTYFLITSEEMTAADNSSVKIEEHNFNKSIYLEYK